MYDKLRNRERGNRCSNDEEQPVLPIESDKQDVLDYFKSCYAKKEIDAIKSKLSETVELRREFLHKNADEIKAMFPFYFADPSLVSMNNYRNHLVRKKLKVIMIYKHSFQILYDFDLLHDKADASVLFGDEWVNIRVRPYELMEKGVDASRYLLSDKHFIDFLHLLKILPGVRYKFETSVKHFVKMTEVIILF